MCEKEIKELIEQVKNFNNKDILVIGNQQNIDTIIGGDESETI